MLSTTAGGNGEPEQQQQQQGGGGYFTSWLKRGVRRPDPSKPPLAPADSAPAAPPLVSLHEPPQVLQVLGQPEGEQEAVEVEVTRVLVRSYFDIVRKNLQARFRSRRVGPGSFFTGSSVPLACRTWSPSRS